MRLSPPGVRGATAVGLLLKFARDHDHALGVALGSCGLLSLPVRPGAWQRLHLVLGADSVVLAASLAEEASPGRKASGRPFVFTSIAARMTWRVDAGSATMGR